MSVSAIDPVQSITALSPYWENRISYEKKWEGTISITETPHITYDKSGNLIITPDQSFALGPKYI
tara:strand:+ start:358 stop:552 length:195 start_codon:yes stop_codon:yes gene_type:complete